LHKLRAAETSLREVLEAASSISRDSENIALLVTLISALGESIIGSRQLHMVNIRLRAATSNVVEWATVRAEGVRLLIEGQAGAAAREAEE
jgi:hypothetical protein